MSRLVLRLAWILLGWIELILLTLVLYTLSYLPARPTPRRWYIRLFRLWSGTFVHALGVDLRLHQKNQHPLPKQFILIANHPSAFEDIGIPALFDVHSVAKVEVRDWWITGRISAAAGTLFVRRESKESRKNVAEKITNALRNGLNIAIYPEGGINGKRLQDDFRYGIFDISKRTGVPILPVYLHYESQDDFHWGDQPLAQKIVEFMLTKNNRVNYYLYDAIQPEQFEDKESYCRFVHEKYLAWQKKYLD